MINSRRLHVCHLQERTANSAPYFWSFIVQPDRSTALFSVESSTPKIISREGNHIELKAEWSFVVSAPEVIDGVKTFRIRLTKDKALKATHDNGHGLIVKGKMEDYMHPIMVAADSKIYETNDSVMIILEFTNDDKVYEDAFKIHFCKDTETVSVALDFGSEASQARFSMVDVNVPLVGVFEDMMGLQRQEKGYWQGKRTDELFKSVFWVTREPAQPTRFGDAPKPLASRPFISPLISSTETAGIYDGMELLPNLKLVELSQGNNLINFGLSSINLKEGSNIEYGQANLADHIMRESVLRIILSNFLHAILSEVNKGTSRKCLRMVVMAPNVYYQNKVFDMMKGLYRDFEVIMNSGAYPRCRGLEVQVVSESDAAFLGARIYKRNSISNAANGYFLNIDSGKGTTDFSILQQQPNFDKFNSLYRDGIPAAGNVITYAYYEALYDFMKAFDIDIHPFFDGASKAALIDFMGLLEELKKQDQPDADLEFIMVPAKSDIKNLVSLVQYLNNNKGRKIPCAAEYVDEKLTLLVDCLKESLEHYMKMNKCTFTKVILSGRALLYHPYKEKLIKMLLDQQWIESDDAIVWIEGDQAKTCCLMGALAVEGECDVNYNSGLIGSPLMHKTANANEGFLERLQSRWASVLGNKGFTTINMDFFYGGSPEISARNTTLRLGGRTHYINSHETEGKKIFFLGDTFASQTGEEPLRMIKSNDLTFDNPVFKQLVTESLFPYYPGSVKAPALRSFFNDQLTEQMRASAAKPVPTTVSASVPNTSKTRPVTRISGGGGITSVDD